MKPCRLFCPPADRASALNALRKLATLARPSTPSHWSGQLSAELLLSKLIKLSMAESRGMLFRGFPEYFFDFLLKVENNSQMFLKTVIIE